MSSTPSLSDIDVRLSDGISIHTPDLGEIRADASTPDAETNFLSHAHGDHLFDAPSNSTILCSTLTAQLAGVRREIDVESVASMPNIELLPAGHIAGSRSALIQCEAGSILYTGDIATSDRYYLEGFTPVEADILVIETTYGKPEYRFPSVDEVEAQTLDWLADNSDRPVIAFAYALGKAQKVIQLLQKSNRESIYTTEAIMKMNDVIANACDVSFDVEQFDIEDEFEAGDVLVLPTGLNQFSWVEKLIRRTDAITAGFSGWAEDQSFIYRRDLDVGFSLSDHCDFDELLTVVEKVNPEKIYTNHGFANEFATTLVKRGYDAQALEKNQATLGDF